MENKTNKQVEGIIFKKNGSGYLFLLMKRIPEKGGFWQPLTGGVRVGEELAQALSREVKEETGIADIRRIVETGYSFTFNDNGKEHREFIFGVEVPSTAEVVLSREHESLVWVTKADALKMLKWPGNIEGLNRLWQLL